MSHGVHAVQHEVEHQIEHEEHWHGGRRRKPLAESTNKKIALLISVLALFLAFSETLGKKSQTEGISLNIKASDTWAFQAKTIRQTTLHTAAQTLTVEAGVIADEARKADSSSRRAEKYETTATPTWRAIITTSTRRPPFRSASCWHRRPSSPA
jgi:hypothetical protein